MLSHGCDIAGVGGLTVSASSGLHLQRPEAREHTAASLWPHHADRLRSVVWQWHHHTHHTEGAWQAQHPSECLADISLAIVR